MQSFIFAAQLSVVVLLFCLAGCTKDTGGGGGPKLVDDCIAITAENEDDYIHDDFVGTIESDVPIKYVRYVRDNKINADRKVEIILGPYPLDGSGDPLKFEIVELPPEHGESYGEIHIVLEKGYVYVVETPTTVSPTHCRPKIKTPRVVAVGEGTRYALFNLVQSVDPPTRLLLWEYGSFVQSQIHWNQSDDDPLYNRHLGSTSVQYSGDCGKYLEVNASDGKVDDELISISDTRTVQVFEAALTEQANHCGVPPPNEE